VPIIFGEIGHLVPEAFKKDREAMSPSGFSTEAMKAAAPFMRDQWRAHAAFIADQLADGRAFLQGEKPTIADMQCHMNVWFMKGAIPPRPPACSGISRTIDPWFARVAAIGHGKPTPMDAKEALAAARDARPEAKPAPDPFEPNGRKPGDKVKVSADDYGRDPVAGEIVFTDAHEIAILRRDPQVGDIVVHFPRAGFVVMPG
jgi:glutathione S-transferase